LIFLIPIVDRMVRMDLRVVTIDVARQEVMPMTVDAVVYFRVIDPAAAVVRVEKYLKATSLISQTTLRSVGRSKRLPGQRCWRAGVLETRGALAAAGPYSVLHGKWEEVFHGWYPSFGQRQPPRVGT